MHPLPRFNPADGSTFVRTVAGCDSRLIQSGSRPGKRSRRNSPNLYPFPCPSAGPSGTSQEKSANLIIDTAERLADGIFAIPAFAAIQLTESAFPQSCEHGGVPQLSVARP